MRECCGAAVLTDDREQTAVWKLRESGLGASAFRPGHPRTWPGAEDAAVPPARLGAYLRRFDDAARATCSDRGDLLRTFRRGLRPRADQLRFHIAPRGSRCFAAAMEQISRALVAEFGGSLSGEHGDGIARSELLPAMYRAGI